MSAPTGDVNPPQAVSEAAVLAALTSIVCDICEVDEQDLAAGRRIGDLGIDSMQAGQVLAEAERTLDIDIDFRLINDEWFDLTVAELANQIWRSALTGRAN